MSEKTPYHEPRPEELEVRRDALLLRIIELRQMIKTTSLDPEIVSKELDELDTKVQGVQGLQAMQLYEELFDTLEEIADSKK